MWVTREARQHDPRRAARPVNQQPNSLPVHLTRFIGRSAELAVIGELLEGNRLVTLTGVGGVGKTRLAAEAAANPARPWQDGIWWTDLSRTKDPPTVAEAVASSIGVIVEPTGGALRSLRTHLRGRAMLGCLDNCEHVLDSAAEVASALLGSCPGVAMLTTSREPLGVPGEVVWPVPPLGEEDAFALFMDRAHLVSPWLTLDALSEEAVRVVCSRLDGVPLALELAAAWLRTLTPQQIEAGLDDRFALLVRASRGVVPRQQSLAASIDWSHTLLDDRERAVFRRLAVFAGSFGLDAAEAVCAGGSVAPQDVLGATARLVDKSLVVAAARDGEARYRLLETIREYAADRLDESGEVTVTRDRHLDHFLAFVEGLEPERPRDMDAWRIRLEPAYDDLRAALDWGLEAPDPERGRRLAAALSWLWHIHRHGREGLDYLQRAIRLAPDDRSRLQARLLTGLAIVVDTAHPLDFEFDAAQQALEIATEHGDDGLRALSLSLSAVGQLYTDFDAAWSISLEARTAAQAAGDAFVADASRAIQGIILHLRDRHADADPLLQSAVEGLLRRHRGIAATILGYQARSALYTGDLERALHLAEEAVDLAEPLRDYLRVGSTRSVLALVYAFAGDTDGGFEIMQPVLRLVEDAAQDVFVPEMARAMGMLHLRRGEPTEAARWLEPEVCSTDRGTPTWQAAEAMPLLGAALALLGQDDKAHAVLNHAVAAAGRFGMPHVLAEAYEQQAQLATANDPARANELHHAALAQRVEHGLRTFYVDGLEAIAALAVRARPTAEVVRWLAASDQARQAMGHPRDSVRQRTHDTVIADLQAALGEPAFGEAWAAGSRLTLDDAIRYVRRSRGARQRPAAGWRSLTPTELEVVRLVIDGLNNPEIGSRLFMSRATVKTHLSHIYTKLGLANRTELATAAVTHLGPGGRRSAASRRR